MKKIKYLFAITLLPGLFGLSACGSMTHTQKGAAVGAAAGGALGYVVTGGPIGTVAGAALGGGVGAGMGKKHH